MNIWEFKTIIYVYILWYYFSIAGHSTSIFKFQYWRIVPGPAGFARHVLKWAQPMVFAIYVEKRHCALECKYLLTLFEDVSLKTCALSWLPENACETMCVGIHTTFKLIYGIAILKQTAHWKYNYASAKKEARHGASIIIGCRNNNNNSIFFYILGAWTPQ